MGGFSLENKCHYELQVQRAGEREGGDMDIDASKIMGASRTREFCSHIPSCLCKEHLSGVNCLILGMY